MYPGLAYMERVATKADVIPLQDPVKCPNGQVISELVVSPGQVCSPVVRLTNIINEWLGCGHPDYLHSTYGFCLEGWRLIPPGTLAGR